MAADEKKRIIALIERHPGSWIFLGLLIFFISTGSLSYEIAGHVIKFQSEPYEVGRQVLQIISISLVLMGFYVILRMRNQAIKAFGIIITAIWALLTFLVLSPSLFKSSSSESAIKFWRYDLKYPQGDLIVTPNAKYLSAFHKKGKGLFFVIYTDKIRKGGNYRHNANVTISRVLDIPLPDSDNKGEFVITNTKQPIDLYNGDDIYFDIGVITKGVSIANCNSIQDVINLGGEILEWRVCPAILDFKTLSNIIEWIKILPVEKQKELKGLLQAI